MRCFNGLHRSTRQPLGPTPRASAKRRRGRKAEARGVSSAEAAARPLRSPSVSLMFSSDSSPCDLDPWLQMLAPHSLGPHRAGMPSGANATKRLRRRRGSDTRRSIFSLEPTKADSHLTTRLELERPAGTRRQGGKRRISASGGFTVCWPTRSQPEGQTIAVTSYWSHTVSREARKGCVKGRSQQQWCQVSMAAPQREQPAKPIRRAATACGTRPLRRGVGGRPRARLFCPWPSHLPMLG